MKKNYTIESIQKFINNYCEECLFQGDSVIGLGDSIWRMNNGLFFIVKEYFINEWSSGHSVRKQKKLSKRQESMINNEKINLLLQD